MIQWEYKSIDIRILELEKGLNELGKDGWQSIHLQYFPTAYHVILQRQINPNHSMVGI